MMDTIQPYFEKMNLLKADLDAQTGMYMGVYAEWRRRGATTK